MLPRQTATYRGRNKKHVFQPYPCACNVELADLVEALDGEGVPAVQGCSMPQPLPDLGARDLGCGGVLHQAVQGHAAEAAEPGLQVLHPHADVVAQGGLGAGALGDLQRREVHVRMSS